MLDYLTHFPNFDRHVGVVDNILCLKLKHNPYVTCFELTTYKRTYSARFLRFSYLMMSGNVINSEILASLIPKPDSTQNCLSI